VGRAVFGVGAMIAGAMGIAMAVRAFTSSKR
jgi:hypothetical protein